MALLFKVTLCLRYYLICIHKALFNCFVLPPWFTWKSNLPAHYCLKGSQISNTPYAKCLCTTALLFSSAFWSEELCGGLRDPIPQVHVVQPPAAPCWTKEWIRSERLSCEATSIGCFAYDNTRFSWSKQTETAQEWSWLCPFSCSWGPSTVLCADRWNPGALVPRGRMNKYRVVPQRNLKGK